MEKEIAQEDETFGFLTIPLEALQRYAETLTIPENAIIKNFILDGSELLNVENVIPQNECIIIAPQSREKVNNIVDKQHTAVRSIVPNNTNNQNGVRYLKCKVSQPVVKTPVIKKRNKPPDKSPIKCSLCTATFNKVTQYRFHMQEHRNMKKYKCEYCAASYNVECNFKLHMAMHVKGDPTCPICNKKFQRLASLKAHLMVHEIDEMFTCSECLVEFEIEDDLYKHLQTHHKQAVSRYSEIPYICSYCNYLFQEADKYKEHVSLHMKAKKLVNNRFKRRIVHSNKEYQHKCDHCSKSFPKVCLLERHRRIHTGEKPFICHICNRGFSQKGTLQIHLDKHNGKKPFECIFCTAKFSQKGNLRVHLEKTHTAGDPGEKLYKCTHCTCIFKTISSLNGHVTKMHSTSLRESSTDIAILIDQLKELDKQSQPPISKNMEINETVEKQSQDKENSNESFVKLAESRLDGEIRRYVVKQRFSGEIRWYICSFCNKEFKKPSDLIRHIRIHTKEKPFKCADCGQCFAHKSTLKNHSTTHLKQDIECGICLKKFNSTRILNVHLKKHENLKVHSTTMSQDSKCDVNLILKQPLIETENGLFSVPAPRPKVPYVTMEQYKNRPHKCTICNAGFTKLVHLNRHMLTHTGAKEFQCELCLKCFTTSYAVKEHMNYHTKTKKYECKYCKKRFYTNSILKRHILMHSSQKPYICPYCKKRFKQAQFCRKHIRLIHKRDLSDSIVALTETGELNLNTKIIDLSDAIDDAAFTDLNTNGIETMMSPIQTYNNTSTVESKIINKENCSTTEATKVLQGEHLDFINKESSQIELQIPETQLREGTDIPAIDVSQIGIENLQDAPGANYPIYITQEEFLLLNNSNVVNSFLPQLKLQNTDPLLLSSINELQDANILYPLDPSITIDESDQQNYEAFNPNLVFNSSISDLNLTITNEKEQTDKEIVSYEPEQIDLELNQIATQKANGAIEDSLIVLNEGQKELSYFNINLSNSDLIDINTLNLPANTSIGTVMQAANLGEQFLCSNCNCKFKNMQQLMQHTCKEKESLNEHSKVQKKGNKYEEPKKCQGNRLTSISEAKIEDPAVDIICNRCDKVFHSKSALLRHNSAKHKETLNNSCKYCEKQFKKRSDLERHLRTHTGEKPFACDKCEKRFSLKSTLMSHLRTHNPIVTKDFKCTTCNQFFSCKSSLKTHMFIHTDEKPFSCNICPAKFRNAHHKKNHMLSHGLQNLIVQEQNLTNEVILQETNEVQDELQQATQNLIANELPITDPLEQNEPIQIDPLLLQLQSGNCPLSLQLEIDGQLINIKPADYNIEILRGNLTNLNENVIEEEVVKKQTKDKKVQCDICYKFYASNSVLNKHKRLLHGKYKCHKCEKAFDNKMALDNHIRMHYGYRPFKCMHCANSFGEEASLKIHLKRIHNL